MHNEWTFFFIFLGILSVYKHFIQVSITSKFRKRIQLYCLPAKRVKEWKEVIIQFNHKIKKRTFKSWWSITYHSIQLKCYTNVRLMVSTIWAQGKTTISLKLSTFNYYTLIIFHTLWKETFRHFCAATANNKRLYSDIFVNMGLRLQ